MQARHSKGGGAGGNLEATWSRGIGLYAGGEARSKREAHTDLTFAHTVPYRACVFRPLVVTLRSLARSLAFYRRPLNRRAPLPPSLCLLLLAVPHPALCCIPLALSLTLRTSLQKGMSSDESDHDDFDDREYAAVAEMMGLEEAREAAEQAQAKNNAVSSPKVPCALPVRVWRGVRPWCVDSPQATPRGLH